ncbi:transport and Golgi organization protein 11 [Leptopilina heterotoma]|uniref:transport and Golgi organization protein 11 n=1 Tax=Leptopilina heterotoma TaxID=63436 RepID=UPI001CA926D5|nr:transport and Golgi organization protein 11 [Leptopilina heterotoma]
MSKAFSSARFNGEADNFFDSNFTRDINNRMRVPKNIQVNGEFADEENNSTNGSTWSQILANDKYEMHVPDRILVVGQEQHIGTKSIPREITLENAVLKPADTGLVRMQTPPRVLTLDNHYFPMLDDDDEDMPVNEPLEMVTATPKTNRQYNDNQITRHVREQTPFNTTLDVTLTPSEEVQHLRRQVGKLHRRIIAVESQIMQRQQRDKILYAISLTYFFLKALSWLTRN